MLSILDSAVNKACLAFLPASLITYPFWVDDAEVQDGCWLWLKGTRITFCCVYVPGGWPGMGGGCFTDTQGDVSPAVSHGPSEMLFFPSLLFQRPSAGQCGTVKPARGPTVYYGHVTPAVMRIG